MATEPLVEVGYEGKKYMIPADIARMNATQPGAARAYLEDQIEEQVLREQQKKQRREESVEAEFTSVKTRLSDLESSKAVIGNLQRENKSLKAAVEAQAAQIDALESSGSAAGSASAEARETAYSLANASTVAQGTLATLQTQNERLNATVEAMQIRLESLQDQFDDQATKALAAGQTRQRLEQEKTNRLLNDVGRAEERAAKAEAQAAEALSRAQAAQIISKNDLTRDQLVSIVQDEIRDSSPRLVNQAIEVIKEDEFGGKSIFGQRMDGDLTRQRRSDADAARNIR